MRRAVIQNLRTLRRPSPRKALKQLRVGHVAFPRAIATRSTSTQSAPPSMRLSRRVSLPIALGVATAASYYAWQQSGAPFSTASVSPTVTGAAAASSTSYSTAATAPAPNHRAPVDGLGAGEVPEAVRKALIVDQGQLYTAQIPADQPISKETDHSGRKVLEMLTPAQADAKLRTNEESYLVGRGEGVVRYDVVQIPSNDPIEDDHIEKIVEIPSTIAAPAPGKTRSDWMFWGVFDGHAGWTTSAKLRQALVSYVARELNATYKSALHDPARTFPAGAAVDAAIKTAFLKLDHEITHDSVQKVLKSQSKAVAAEILAPALSGSCALLSFYESRSKELRVACTGDSRAVLGRRSATSGKWTATPLSVDQTGGTASEDARLRAEHPNEPYVTANGRILGGLEPSRAFGDAVYKWSKATQEQIKSAYFGRTPSKYLKTPPYVTAEPVVTTTTVEPARGDFVVMATDGLWEMLTNEEVVGLVGQWLDAQGSGSSNTTSGANTNNNNNSTAGWLKSWFRTQPPPSSPASLPIEHHHDQESPTGQRAPMRQQQWNLPSSPQASRFVTQDKNAATHLVRNALGGKDTDMLCSLLTLPSPFSRRYRDDLTVQVIFFGEGDGGEDGSGGGGGVELNREASATACANADAGGRGGEVKARL
ncbi:hypothetical protein LTR08_003369 [Meristemomyces frigidus]|nr:hypothetical protein LTR08_003369 [Meristemomyces frigidus]